MGNGKYIKGAHAERELSKLLQAKGFYVVRGAGSGSDGVSPDLVVLSSTKKFALECKAWKNSLHFPKEKIVLMFEWEKITGMPYFIGWKRPREEWRFFPLFALKETPQGYSLNEEGASLGLSIEQVVA